MSQPPYDLEADPSNIEIGPNTPPTVAPQAELEEADLVSSRGEGTNPEEQAAGSEAVENGTDHTDTDDSPEDAANNPDNNDGDTTDITNGENQEGDDKIFPGVDEAKDELDDQKTELENKRDQLQEQLDDVNKFSFLKKRKLTKQIEFLDNQMDGLDDRDAFLDVVEDIGEDNLHEAADKIWPQEGFDDDESQLTDQQKTDKKLTEDLANAFEKRANLLAEKELKSTGPFLKKFEAERDLETAEEELSELTEQIQDRLQSELEAQGVDSEKIDKALAVQRATVGMYTSSKLTEKAQEQKDNNLTKLGNFIAIKEDDSKIDRIGKRVTKFGSVAIIGAGVAAVAPVALAAAGGGAVVGGLVGGTFTVLRGARTGLLTATTSRSQYAFDADSRHESRTSSIARSVVDGNESNISGEVDQYADSNRSKMKKSIIVGAVAGAAIGTAAEYADDVVNAIRGGNIPEVDVPAPLDTDNDGMNNKFQEMVEDFENNPANQYKFLAVEDLDNQQEVMDAIASQYNLGEDQATELTQIMQDNGVFEHNDHADRVMGGYEEEAGHTIIETDEGEVKNRVAMSDKMGDSIRDYLEGSDSPDESINPQVNEESGFNPVKPVIAGAVLAAAAGGGLKARSVYYERQSQEEKDDQTTDTDSDAEATQEEKDRAHTEAIERHVQIEKLNEDIKNAQDLHHQAISDRIELEQQSVNPEILNAVEAEEASRRQRYEELVEQRKQLANH